MIDGSVEELTFQALVIKHTAKVSHYLNKDSLTEEEYSKFIGHVKLLMEFTSALVGL